MTPLLALPLLAGIGLLYAALWTVYAKALSDNRAVRSALMDAVITSFSFIAWAIMSSTGFDNKPSGIIAYSIGGAIGTYIIVKRRQPNQTDGSSVQVKESALREPKDD